MTTQGLQQLRGVWPVAANALIATVDSGSQTCGAEVLTGIRLDYLFKDSVEFYIFGNNIFDVIPEEVTNSGSRCGLFELAPGLAGTGSPTVLKYSRRPVPDGLMERTGQTV